MRFTHFNPLHHYTDSDIDLNRMDAVNAALDLAFKGSKFSDIWDHYAYGSGWDLENKKFSFKEGMYLYEGDPPLYPLAKHNRGNEVIWIYPYDLIVITDREDSVITYGRLD